MQMKITPEKITKAMSARQEGGQNESPVPAAPIFARGAQSGLSVLKDTLARQQAMRNTLDLSSFPDADDELDEDDGLDVRSSGNVRKSPAIARRSPGVRSLGGVSGLRSRAENTPTKVLDFLFLGSVQDAKNVEFLRRNNITQILNVSQEEYYSPDPENVVVRWFYAEDTCNFEIQKYFAVTEHILQTARKFYFSTKDAERRERVLVHCQKGRSRSATIVMAHLIRSNGWSVAEALHWVASLREQVEPNLGFIDALREYQESMTLEERTLLRSRRCLLIRNIIPEGMVLSTKSSRTAHTPLERDPRTSADGTTFPLLTLDVLRNFFGATIGMVSDVQIKVKSKEVVSSVDLDALAADEEEDDVGEQESVGQTQDDISTPPNGSGGEKSDARGARGGSTGESRSVTPSREHTTSTGFTGTSEADGGESEGMCLAQTDDSTNIYVDEVPPVTSPLGAEFSSAARRMPSTRQRSSRASISRSNSGISQSITVRSAQILVEFACHENVDVAGMLKKTDVYHFLPICPDPTTLLFQKPLSKTAARKKKKLTTLP